MVPYESIKINNLKSIPWKDFWLHTKLFTTRNSFGPSFCWLLIHRDIHYYVKLAAILTRILLMMAWNLWFLFFLTLKSSWKSHQMTTFFIKMMKLCLKRQHFQRKSCEVAIATRKSPKGLARTSHARFKPCFARTSHTC